MYEPGVLVNEMTLSLSIVRGLLHRVKANDLMIGGGARDAKGVCGFGNEPRYHRIKVCRTSCVLEFNSFKRIT